jgi:phenylacetate-coenzyme A ligase PaaK-like adenylate-forming protein
MNLKIKEDENMMSEAELEFQKRIEKFIPPKENWTPIDKALFTEKSYFNNYQKISDLTSNAIKYSFNHHYENNSLYRRLCEVNNISPESINSKDEFNKLPLLPDSFFKDYPEDKGYLNWLDNVYTGKTPMPKFDSENPDHDTVIEEFNKKGVSIMFTSGTSGRFSFIPRDNGSWKRLKYNAMRSVVELMDYNIDDTVILLIPDPRLTNLTIASLFGIAYDLYKPENIHVALDDLKITIQYLRMQRSEAIGIKEKIKAKAISKLSPLVLKRSDNRIISLLENLEKEGKRVNLAGPPFWLNRIIDRMIKDGKKVKLPTSQVLTGGGWKAEEDKRTPEETFREKVENVLGIPQDRFHDVYAMSECSSVFLSCEGHYKHVPPTIIPLVLDENLNSVGYDKFGRFAFIDPIPESYPGFIITGDKVKLIEKCPVCKREGPVLDIEVSRLPGVEGRGCAAVMADLMSQEE